MLLYSLRCISFDSYIKPQPKILNIIVWRVVYLLIPTSNHNSLHRVNKTNVVVYLLIPTSNHNLTAFSLAEYTLYIFWFLHQTTTEGESNPLRCALYIFWFLHQTTTYEYIFISLQGCISFDSYIKPQQPQLTESGLVRCISFDSYIKPQLLKKLCFVTFVVYLLIPTSNHNPSSSSLFLLTLYIFWFLHQTTT